MCEKFEPNSLMGTASPGTGLLIDFSDEEKIPFPQQLMLTAEVDDTFGLFASKPRSASVPISDLTSGLNGGDVFSPKVATINNESMDSVFESANSQRTTFRSMSTGKIGFRMERKDSVLSSISNISSIRDSSTSTYGLNEGFVESTQSDITEPSDSLRNSLCTTAETEERGDSTDKENSPRGIMDSPDKNDSQLLDLSGFTISEGEPEPEVCQKAREEVIETTDTEPDIFARVLKRQSLMKQGNEAIARKVQEMFDAASPSKNPQLFVSIPKFRTYTPARKPVSSEPFCYGTPKRQMQFPFNSSIVGTEELITDSPLCSNQTVEQPSSINEFSTNQEEKRQERIIAHVIPTPTRNSTKSLESETQSTTVKDSEKGRGNTPVRMRLSFSSTSSESIPERLTSMKEVKTAIIHPRIQHSIVFQAKPKINVVGQRHSGELKDLQPLKAVHSVVPPKLASAPVYRKFPAPVATSSPITTTSKVRPQETPPRHTKSSLARQNTVHRTSMSPSAKSLNTSQSRIPQSPKHFKAPLEHNTHPIPKRKPLAFASSDQSQPRQSITTKRRSISQGSAEPNKFGNMSSGLRSNGIPKESKLAVKKIGIQKF